MSASLPGREETRLGGGADTVRQSRVRAQRDVGGKQETHFHLPSKVAPSPTVEPVSHKAPGRPISECDPYDLEVHPALQAPPRPGATSPVPHRHDARLPTYVRRPHDEKLARVVEEAAQGNSGMAVLVGSSSTGKTRACWEAVQPLAELGWRLWHPVDPTRAEAALAALGRITPHTVVWLNEAQHYLGAGSGTGERVAAALHTLLTDPDRAPVLVLGTLWPDYAHAYTRRPAPGESDVHAQARTLLEGRLLHVPDAFDQTALDEARRHAGAGDAQWAHALELGQQRGRVAQVLAARRAAARLERLRPWPWNRRTRHTPSRPATCVGACTPQPWPPPAAPRPTERAGPPAKPGTPCSPSPTSKPLSPPAPIHPRSRLRRGLGR